MTTKRYDKNYEHFEKETRPNKSKLIPCFHYIGPLFAPSCNGSCSNGNRYICDPIRIIFCFHLERYDMTYFIHFIHYIKNSFIKNIHSLKSLLIKTISQISYSNIDPVPCVSLSEEELCRTYPIQKSCRKMSVLMETESLSDTKSVTDQ